MIGLDGSFCMFIFFFFFFVLNKNEKVVVSSFPYPTSFYGFLASLQKGKGRLISMISLFGKYLLFSSQFAILFQNHLLTIFVFFFCGFWCSNVGNVSKKQSKHLLFQVWDHLFPVNFCFVLSGLLLKISLALS